MKTAFQGKPLIDLSTVPQIGFLEGDFGREVLQQYNKRVAKNYQGNKNLRVLNQGDDLVTGSNPYAVVLANQILREEGLRTATQADLEKALRFNVLDLRGTYEDTGLVLRSEGEPNAYLARDLARQIAERTLIIQYPILINLTDLELKVDQNSPYGLSFKLRQDAVPIYAPTLNSPNGKFNSEDIDESTGLPKQVGEEGSRYLWTTNSGLSRLCLSWVLGACSGYALLACSDFGGRVVFVSGEVTQKI